MNRQVPAALALAACLTASALASPCDDNVRFEGTHDGVFNGEGVRYASIVEALRVEPDEAPGACFVTTAYVRQDVPDSGERPVVFLFNGGPSVPASWLHMGAFGPVRILPPQDPADAVPEPHESGHNPYSILDAADLVFIDPPETGFSRALDPEAREALYSVDGDAAAVSAFVKAWTAAHGREGAPVFLVGESYGTIRAAAMAGRLAGARDLRGVVLFGQAVNMVETTQRRGNVMAYATNLSALAAIAAWHGRADTGGLALDAFIDEAERFAMGEYLNALTQGAELDEAGREAVAARLEALTGIRADRYLENRLVITKPDFRRELLASEGLILGMYDARYAGPGPEDAFAPVAAMVPPLLEAHMTGTLGVALDFSDYRFSAPGTGGWDWGRTGGMTGGPFADYDYAEGLRAAFEADPRFRLMIGTGIYDTTTTIGPARYLHAQSEHADRISLHEYAGGHMAYTNEDALRAFTGDVRAFVTGD